MIWSTIALGFLGGVMPDTLKLVALRTQGAPNYFWSGFFWGSFVILGLLGLLACWLVSPGAPIEAFAVGYSAPSILTRLGGKVPASVRTRGKVVAPSKLTLREWWGI